MSISLEFAPGLPLQISESELSFKYGRGMFGPEPEMRRLDQIRPSLRDPQCDGPDPVYGIAMDIGSDADRAGLQERMLLFGAVLYASGRLGSEPVRSQGHIHAVAPHCGWSTPEIFEIWSGTAIVYAQEFAADYPGRCIAVVAGPGEKVVVPPGWAHCVINADCNRLMAFGAWCDRQYGFDYTGVRSHGGLAFFPVVAPDGRIEWTRNPRYRSVPLAERKTRDYPELILDPDTPIYEQYQSNPESVEWVAQPQRLASLWLDFEP